MIVHEGALKRGDLPVNKIVLGDALDVLKKFPDNSVDAVVTDPPYGLRFMNQKWDYDVPSVELWREVLRVMKPGAHLLSFFGTRTYHRGVVNIEDAGFEIRDMIQWLYGCVSEDTEVLTVEGWKKYNEIKKGDKVFTFNLKTGKIEVDEVKEVYIYHHKGKMINIVNDNTDQLLTLNHKVICDIAKREKVSEGVPANRRKYVFTGFWKWTYAYTLNNTSSRIKLPLAGIYDGNISIGVELAELIGWIISEGSIKWSNKGEKSIRIYQSSSNSECVEIIRNLLNKLGVYYKEYMRERDYKDKRYIEYQWFISYGKNKWLFDKILRFFPEKNAKKPSWGLLRLKYEERLALINALMWGDGSWSSKQFYQYDEETLIWFQTLCHITGIQARINHKKHCCALHFNPTTEIQLLGRRKQKYVRVVEYEGIVWSIRTNNMTYIARRNGKIFITGNSGFPKSMDISKAIDKELGKLEERVVIGTTRCGYRRCGGSDEEVFLSSIPKEKRIVPVTEPATPEAKQWQGWGTSLKPANEPIVLARKPLSEKNVARNVLKWGVGGLNIGACRIPVDEKSMSKYRPPSDNHHGGIYQGGFGNSNGEYTPHPQGRYPANVILDEEAAKMLDEQSGYSKSVIRKPTMKENGIYGYSFRLRDITERGYDDSGGASRFFYVAKASRDERFAYCQDCDEVIPQKEWSKHKEHKVIFHTTVKPLKLMEYLVRLITPPDGIVLDPFFGTGTTGVACLKRGFRFIGIEIDPIYCKIAEHRLKPHLKQKKLVEFV